MFHHLNIPRFILLFSYSWTLRYLLLFADKCHHAKSILAPLSVCTHAVPLCSEYEAMELLGSKGWHLPDPLRGQEQTKQPLVPNSWSKVPGTQPASYMGAGRVDDPILQIRFREVRWFAHIRRACKRWIRNKSESNVVRWSQGRSWDGTDLLAGQEQGEMEYLLPKCILASTAPVLSKNTQNPNRKNSNKPSLIIII